MEPKVTNFTQHGQCSCCGQCCGSLLPVTDEEMQTLKQFIRNNHIRPSTPDQQDFITMQCPLLNPTSALMPHASCKAYPVRPAICRVFKCDQTEQQTAALFYQETHQTPPGDLQNLWSLFDLTGIQVNGHHIKWSDAPAVVVTTDEQEQYRFQSGQPLDLGLTNGQMISGMVVDIRPDGLDMIDRKTHKPVFIKFSKIGGVLSPNARYTEQKSD